MRMECFAGDAVIEADTVDGLVDHFLAHAVEQHDWSYPESALRNYARNYGEATERLTGGTERLNEIGEVAENHSFFGERRIESWRAS